MANRKSTFISNIETALRTYNDVRVAGAEVKLATATIEVAAADDDGVILAMVRLPSQAVLLSALIMNDAITGGTDYDLGVFTPNEGSGDPVAVDADCLIDLVSMASARAIPTEFLGTGTNGVDPANLGKPLWELAGVSADPGDDTLYDLCFTGNTVGTAAGTITLAVLYTVLGN
jgi:hypothetical protein